MADIIKRDFGKADREHARRLARLLDLVEAQEADMLANPGEYLKMAADKLVEVAALRHELYDAIHPRISLGPFDPMNYRLDTIVIDKAEWERWKAVQAIIRAKCGA